jgi:hypothetical protein
LDWEKTRNRSISLGNFLANQAWGERQRSDWSYRKFNELIYQWALEILTRSDTGREGWRPTRGCTGWTAGRPLQRPKFSDGYYHRLPKLEHYWEMKPDTIWTRGESDSNSFSSTSQSRDLLK